MSDHYHGEYAYSGHDHDYAEARHDHDIDYAALGHRHFDDERMLARLERTADELVREVRELREALNGYERDLADARGRIRQLEEHFPADPDEWGEDA